jgi:hypothetical protein
LIGCRYFDIFHEIIVPYDRANLSTYRFEDLKPTAVHLAELLQLYINIKNRKLGIY